MNLVDTFEEHRSLLFATAYRMLGDATEAEDIVQEAYLRFQATTREIRSPRAYLCTIVTHLCLDALHSARITREQYLGPWLPQPIPGESDDMPIQAALEHESISLAWLILLERLTPQERAVFVLHEVFEYPHAEIAAMIGLTAPNCRQLFHRAQQHLAIARARFCPPPETHRQIVNQFLEAVQVGNLSALTALLADDLSGAPGGRDAASIAQQRAQTRQYVGQSARNEIQCFPPGKNGSTRQIIRRGAAVSGVPVLGVPVGSINKSWTSSSAYGQCSTPRGTTNNSPGPSSTSPSRSWMRSRPCSTRKKSSVSACECQTNSPFTFTTMMSYSLNCATVRGAQWSPNCDSFSNRLIASYGIARSS
jgi:RNA polymerase sigma-70 factor (ECF subfamily)